MSSTVISFQNVSFRYTNCESRSLSDVTLDIEKGECVLLCGASGCGKTTVTVDGKKYRSRQMLKICYMVMQDVNHQLFAETVLEEAMLGMETENEEQALDMLKKLGLYELRDRHPMSLSGGQKQRTAIASAILAGKRILIFDEPTSGLDYNSMVQTAKLIGSLDKSITVLIVTHDMELIERCCTHILHIENGRIDEVLL